jgi:hypothetical protein
LLDLSRELVRILIFAREDDVAAVQVSLHTGVAKATHDLAEVDHRNPLVAADVDSPQQRNKFRQRAAKRTPWPAARFR